MKTPLDIANLRAAYARAVLDERSAEDDAIEQFGVWFREALAAEIPEPNACTLATVTRGCQAAARVILLKGFDYDGFVFYTNYASRKARELEAHEHAALVFWWIELERQVRIEGVVERVADEESDVYWATRPRGSQLGAWASEQSEAITSRAALERTLAEVTERYRGHPVPRPPHWGGYRLQPSCVEFWQGRPDRLHDRLLYTRAGHGWEIKRLAP
jgi:pyridoxamine 5'-phosphate oxidase